MITTKDNYVFVKLEKYWTPAENEVALGNFRALNAIYNGVNKNIYKNINICISAKDTWEILEVSHKSTSKVCMSRLHLVTTKFENLKMCDNGIIFEFNLSFMTLLVIPLLFVKRYLMRNL